MPVAPDAGALELAERETYSAAMREFIEGDPAAALVEIEPLTRREPWYVPAHVLYQDSLVEGGHADAIRLWYGSEAELETDDAARVLLAGRVAERARGAREIAYRRAVELDSDSPWPSLALAYELTRAAREIAERSVLAADEGYPAESDAAKLRALELHGEAARLTADLLVGHPALADVHAAAAEVALTLGVAAGDRESVRAARGHAERATRLDPGHPRWWALLARVRREMIDDVGAELALLKALDLAPDDAGLLASLGRVLLDLGRPGEARDALMEARSLREDDPVIAADLGVAFHRVGEFEDAVRELERAARLDPADPRSVEALALVQLDAGHLEAAAEAARAYLRRGGKDRASAERILRELGEIDAGADVVLPPPR